MTEWIQIAITLVVIVPLMIVVGRYIVWRQWDMERRELRRARVLGLREYYADNPGFSVKV